MTVIKIYFFSMLLAFTWMAILKRGFNFSLVFGFLSSTFIMLLFGYANNLYIGYLVNIIFLFILLAYFILKNQTTTVFKNIIHDILTSEGFYAYSLLFLFVNWFHSNSAIIEWDEITFWSPIVRQMFNTNKLYYISGSAFQASATYPPFIQLFELLFCYLAGVFEEKYLYRALSVFSIALFCIVFDNKKIKSVNNIIETILFCSSVVFLNVVHFVTEHTIGGGFTTFFETILVDQWIATLCAVSLFIIITKKVFDSIDTLLLVMLFSALTLSKQVGIPLFLMGLFLLIFKIIINKNNKKNILYLTTIPVIMIKIWNWMVSINRQSEINSLIPTISNNADKSYWKTSIDNFIYSIFHSPMIKIGELEITYFPLCFIALMLITIYLFIEKKRSNEIILSIITYIIGCVGWTMMMEYLYLTVFGSYEGVVLASFERYINTYTYMSLALVMMLYSNLSNNGISIKLFIMLGLLILTNGTNLKLLNPKNRYNYKEDIKNKELFSQIDKYINNEKVLVLSQTRDYFIEIYLKYLYPQKHFEFVSVNANEYDNKHYLNLTPEQWKLYYQNFDYIYLYNTDERFYKEFWKNIEKEDLLNDRLYIVEQEGLKIMPWFSYQE